MTTFSTFSRFPEVSPRIKVVIGDTIVAARVVSHKNILVFTARVIPGSGKIPLGKTGPELTTLSLIKLVFGPELTESSRS